MMDAFFIGLMAGHFIYGLAFFAFGLRRHKRPALWVCLIAIFFWPLMVQHLIEHAKLDLRP